MAGLIHLVAAVWLGAPARAPHLRHSEGARQLFPAQPTFLDGAVLEEPRTAEPGVAWKPQGPRWASSLLQGEVGRSPGFYIRPHHVTFGFRVT